MRKFLVFLFVITNLAMGTHTLQAPTSLIDIAPTRESLKNDLAREKNKLNEWVAAEEARISSDYSAKLQKLRTTEARDRDLANAEQEKEKALQEIRTQYQQQIKILNAQHQEKIQLLQKKPASDVSSSPSASPSSGDGSTGSTTSTQPIKPREEVFLPPLDSRFLSKPPVSKEETPEPENTAAQAQQELDAAAAKISAKLAAAQEKRRQLKGGQLAPLKTRPKPFALDESPSSLLPTPLPSTLAPLSAAAEAEEGNQKDSDQPAAAQAAASSGITSAGLKVIADEFNENDYSHFITTLPPEQVRELAHYIISNPGNSYSTPLAMALKTSMDSVQKRKLNSQFPGIIALAKTAQSAGYSLAGLKENKTQQEVLAQKLDSITTQDRDKFFAMLPDPSETKKDPLRVSTSLLPRSNTLKRLPQRQSAGDAGVVDADPYQKRMNPNRPSPINTILQEEGNRVVEAKDEDRIKVLIERMTDAEKIKIARYFFHPTRDTEIMNKLQPSQRLTLITEKNLLQEMIPSEIVELDKKRSNESATNPQALQSLQSIMDELMDSPRLESINFEDTKPFVTPERLEVSIERIKAQHHSGEEGAGVFGAAKDSQQPQSQKTPEEETPLAKALASNETDADIVRKINDLSDNERIKALRYLWHPKHYKSFEKLSPEKQTALNKEYQLLQESFPDIHARFLKNGTNRLKASTLSLKKFSTPPLYLRSITTPLFTKDRLVVSPDELHEQYKKEHPVENAYINVSTYGMLPAVRGIESLMRRSNARKATTTIPTTQDPQDAPGKISKQHSTFAQMSESERKSERKIAMREMELKAQREPHENDAAADASQPARTKFSLGSLFSRKPSSDASGAAPQIRVPQKPVHRSDGL